MRSVLAFAIMLCLAGCETSPLGGRCTSNLDCEHPALGVAATTQCILKSDGISPCSGNNFCICCPTGIVGSDSGVPFCRPIVVTDSGVLPDVQDVPVVDAAVDVVADAGPSCSCPAGSYCSGSLPDGGVACTAQKPIGVSCLGANECQTDHCVDGVCCNSACTGAGLSCNVSPDFAGLCSPEATVDAGTDTGITDTGVTDTGVTDTGITDTGIDAPVDAATE